MKSTEERKLATSDVKDMMSAFEEATSITINLVAIPIVLLIVGVFIDKTFSTTPIFIFIGIIAGVGLGIYRALAISKKYKFKVKTFKKNKKNG